MKIHKQMIGEVSKYEGRERGEKEGDTHETQRSTVIKKVCEHPTLCLPLIIAIFLCKPSLFIILYLPIQRVTLDPLTNAHSALPHPLLHSSTIYHIIIPFIYIYIYIYIFIFIFIHSSVHPSIRPCILPPFHSLTSLIHSLTHSSILHDPPCSHSSPLSSTISM